MEHALPNLPDYLLIAAFVLLIIDAALFGFSTFFLTLVAGGLFIAGSLFYFEPFSQVTSAAMIVATCTVSTLVFTVLAWKPLKQIQNSEANDHLDQISDLVGGSFTLTTEVGPGIDALQRYSGVAWMVDADAVIAQGTKVVITGVSVGVLTVKDASQREAKPA